MPSPEYLDALVLNQASLPKARQWLQWLEYHTDNLPSAHGWEALLRDTLVRFHHQVAITARRLRGNPIWDIQGTMREDTAPLEPEAIKICGTLEAFYPRNKDGRWKGCPEHFQKAMDCLYGALRQQVRLAREIDEMRDTGRINVDVLLDQKEVTLVEQ